MMRYGAATFIIVLLWQTVGFNFNFSVPQITYGNLGFVERTVTTLLPTRLINVELSATKASEKFDSLVFVGDVMLARNVEYLMTTKGAEYPFAGVNLKDFSPRPAIVANFEASVPSTHIPTPMQMLDFSVPTSSLLSLSDAGYTHVSLGNNHSYDFLADGLAHTRTVLTDSFVAFGDPHNTVSEAVTMITIGDTQVALIGIHGLIELSEADTKKLLSKAKKMGSQFEIVYIHWGEEYALRHNNEQKRIAQMLISEGADLIIGHHPHVVQGIEVIEGVPVFYSLGNYIFDQYFSADVQEGLVLAITLDNGLFVHLVPVSSQTTLSQPNFMLETQHAEFLSKLARKSEPALEGQIISGVLDFRSPVASSEKVAIMHDAFQYVQ